MFNEVKNILETIVVYCLQFTGMLTLWLEILIVNLPS